jgi:radical SAM protein with 4Fe4S-binding SPASM domain
MAATASGQQRKPVVVWNITRACNLHCRHCYSNSDSRCGENELTTLEAKAVLDDLAAFGVPVILFSGGEPILRSDLFELIKYAREKGIKAVLSTNGTLIDEPLAGKIVSVGVDYVGVSLDSADETTHDRFRGVKGAWAGAIGAIRRLKALGQKVGLRITLARSTIEGIDSIFDLLERESIDRVCFYHLVPAGRGTKETMVEPKRVRLAMETILQRSREQKHREILTVDNHCDGPFVYMKLKKSGDPRADEVYRYLKWNGGGLASSGVGIACIDWSGEVHADQFWMDYTLGNVRKTPFSKIWSNENEPLLAKLRQRQELITGRCRGCRFFELCGGGLRARAKNLTGDPWASDPACYLEENEILG